MIGGGNWKEILEWKIIQEPWYPEFATSFLKRGRESFSFGFACSVQTPPQPCHAAHQEALQRPDRLKRPPQICRQSIELCWIFTENGDGL